MAMRFDIVEFCRDLCVENVDHLLAEEEFETIDLIQNVAHKVDCFRDSFCTKLHRVYRKKIAAILDTEEQFLRYAIPRCLRIIETEHYYFSFLLVAAFIQELAYYIEYKRDCFRFKSVAYKCLAAVFSIKFRDTFEENGGWEGLSTYCGILDDIYVNSGFQYITDVVTDGDIAHTKRVYKLIKECDISNNEDFELNAYELHLVAIDQDLGEEAERYLSPSDSDTDDSSLDVGQGSEENNDMDQMSRSTNPGRRYWHHHSSSESESSSGNELVLSSDIESDHGDQPFVPKVASDRDGNSNELSDAELRRRLPKEYGKTTMERMCQWCGKKCYQYAKYFVTRHANLRFRDQTTV